MSKDVHMLLGSEINYKVIVISEHVITRQTTEGICSSDCYCSSDCHLKRHICLRTTRAGGLFNLDLYLLVQMPSKKIILLGSTGMKSCREPG